HPRTGILHLLREHDQHRRWRSRQSRTRSPLTSERMKPRYVKVIRDLTANYSKNFMLVLAIALGVFGVGSILGGRAVINREMATNYMSTKPASATIEFEGTISRTLLDSIK